ncbi:MAG: divergent polysaccharide deacetylase family protein [Agarilytica sp.]
MSPTKGSLKRLSLLILVSCLVTPFFSAQSEDLMESFPEAALRAKISIIIDDLGYGYKPALGFTDLPYPITLAIIPFTPYGRDIAALAKNLQKEVMLHAPMETMGRGKWEAGLTVDMDEIETFTTINDMLSDIPHVQGVNNHGGSRLTQDRDRMSWIMSFLAERELYFVDSRTIASSIAEEAARNAQIAYSARDVFLDNDKSPELIREQLHKLQTIALEQGRAIGIGHPYAETLEILTEELPLLNQQGIKLVKVSELLDKNPSNFGAVTNKKSVLAHTPNRY